MKNFASFVFIFSVIAALGACTPHDTASVYSDGDVGKAVKIEFGTILSMRTVKVRADENDLGVGTAGGGIAGGVAGSQIGNGNGSVVGIIGGAIIGAVVGKAVERDVRERDATEYIISRDDGKTVSVVQNIAKDDPVMKPGERVMVQIKGISGKGVYMRVLPAGDIVAPKQPRHHKKSSSDDDDNDVENKEDAN